MLTTINISVIGCGHVGARIIQLLLHSTSFRFKINIIENNDSQNGKLLELFHISSLFKQHQLEVNAFHLISEADVIIYSAGVNKPILHARTEVLQDNILLTHSIFAGLQLKKDCLLLVATNPVDAISFFISKISNHPSELVIGSGTYLDGLRFIYELSKLANCKIKQCKGDVIGEHGESMVLQFSSARINHMNFSESDYDTPLHRQLLIENTRNSARRIKQTEGFTSIGISEVCCSIIEYYFSKTTTVLNLSVKIDKGDYDFISLDAYLYMSVPVRIGNKKVKKLKTIDLDETEKILLNESAKNIQAINKRIIYP